MKILSVSDVVKPRLFQYSDARPYADVDLSLSYGDLPPNNRITGRITNCVSASAATQHMEAPISANNTHPTPFPPLSIILPQIRLHIMSILIKLTV